MASNKNINRPTNVLWKGLLSPGHLPKNDEISNFRGSKGLIYRINFQSKRQVRSLDTPVNGEPR